jgi:hypothetical protein
MGFESNILATTGFQNRNYKDKSELLCLLKDVMKSESKTLEFVQGSLRSASDVYKKNGNVTWKYRDQQFRMHYDNRRLLDTETSIPSAVERLVDSKPLTQVKQAENMRYIGSLYKKKMYSKFVSGGESVIVNRYKDKSEIAIRNFLKGVVSSPPLFNLPSNVFKTNIDLVNFVKDYNPSIRICVKRISLYKTRSVKLGKVVRSKESDEFITYVKHRFPSFKTENFYLWDKKMSKENE